MLRLTNRNWKFSKSQCSYGFMVFILYLYIYSMERIIKLPDAKNVGKNIGINIMPWSNVSIIKRKNLYSTNRNWNFLKSQCSYGFWAFSFVFLLFHKMPIFGLWPMFFGVLLIFNLSPTMENVFFSAWKAKVNIKCYANKLNKIN